MRELQANFTIDESSGVTRVYLLELDKHGQWQWLTDQEFGPFETTLDVCTWLTRALVHRHLQRLR